MSAFLVLGNLLRDRRQQQGASPLGTCECDRHYLRKKIYNVRQDDDDRKKKRKGKGRERESREGYSGGYYRIL